MALNITHCVVGGVSALEGRIVLGEETLKLREEVKGLVAAGRKKIVLIVTSNRG
jgi:hypothetical protein